MLQCVAVCCSVVQCLAVQHNVVQCSTVCCSVVLYGSVVQCVAVCYIFHSIKYYYFDEILLFICCSMLQWVVSGLHSGFHTCVMTHDYM